MANPEAKLEVRNPATGELLDTVVDGGAEETRQAIDAAHAALPGWRGTRAWERSRILRCAAAELRAEAPRIAKIMTQEQGKPLSEATGEVEYAASFFDWFGGEVERVYGRIVPPVEPDQRVIVLRQPIGVVAAITPWNFPAAMLARKAAPALAAGCTTVIKPAESTPLTALEVARVIRDAGLPDGALNVVTSNRPAEVAGAFFDDPRVRKLSFTGSTAVGKELIRRSADGVKRLSLELGGHAPYIVFADAAVDHAVEQVMRSKFRNAGQTCVCANRIYVQREIHAEFVERLTIATAALVVGNGLSPGVQVGPLIDAKAVDQVERHVEDAVARGATILTGGRRVTGSGFDRGSFYAPTVLDGVAPDALMSQDETFGPVAGVSAFDNEEQVIAMANDTNFGLASYLHTRDYERLLRVAEQLEHGIVGVNTGTISYANAPFGGIKQSGYGREGGSEGIEEYLETKHVLIAGVGAAA